MVNLPSFPKQFLLMTGQHLYTYTQIVHPHFQIFHQGEKVQITHVFMVKGIHGCQISIMADMESILIVLLPQLLVMAYNSNRTSTMYFSFSVKHTITKFNNDCNRETWLNSSKFKWPINIHKLVDPSATEVSYQCCQYKMEVNCDITTSVSAEYSIEVLLVAGIMEYQYLKYFTFENSSYSFLMNIADSLFEDSSKP